MVLALDQGYNLVSMMEGPRKNLCHGRAFANRTLGLVIWTVARSDESHWHTPISSINYSRGKKLTNAHLSSNRVVDTYSCDLPSSPAKQKSCLVDL